MTSEANMPDIPLPANDVNYPEMLEDDPWLEWLWVVCPPGFPFVTNVPWIYDRVGYYDS